MRIDVACDLLGLGEALSPLLPGGVEPTSLRITPDALRIEGRAIFGIPVALTARVTHFEGGLRVTDFGFEGPGEAMVLAGLRARIAALDATRHPLRLRGEEGGAALRVGWA